MTCGRFCFCCSQTTGQVTRFFYDGDGKRVKQVRPDGSYTVYVGQWYEETWPAISVGEPNEEITYYYLDSRRIGMTRWWKDAELPGWQVGVYYVHTDHLGSTSEASTATASLSGQERYFPYGQVRYSSGSIPTTYNYTGQRLDGTGLLYYGARYYHPLLGRFVQADTIVPQPGNPQSLNRYAYTLNNPLRYTDPTGHYIYEGGYNDDYDPTHHSYTLPNTAGLLGAEVWFLGPEDAAAIYGVATPMRVAMWSVVAVSDQPGALVNQGSVAAAAALAAAVPRNPGPSSLGGVVAPEGIGADPWEAGAWRTVSLEEVAEARAARGLPPKVGTEGRTVAVLAADGEVYVGVSGSKPIEFRVNAISIDHAEIDALNQLYLARQRSGVTGGHASLAVDQVPCRACWENAGLRSAVRAVGLESLTVIYPGGTMIVTPYSIRPPGLPGGR